MIEVGKVITFNKLKALKKNGLRGKKVVAASGAFDPLHPGHLSYLAAAKDYGDVLVVIVNGDSFIQHKRGQAFQPLKTRCQIIAALRMVDYVVPFELEDDFTVCRALIHLRPDVFVKGGFENKETLPEWKTCKKYKIEVVTGVGGDKEWSSQQLLDGWEEYCNTKAEGDKVKESPEINKLKKLLEEDRAYFTRACTTEGWIKQYGSWEDLVKFQIKHKIRQKLSKLRKARLKKLVKKSKEKRLPKS